MGAYGGPLNCGWLPFSDQDIVDYILGKFTLSEAKKNECDLNKDGFLNICDVILFLNP
jgi:hypothetical protein